MHSNFVLHLPNEILADIINQLALDIDIDNDKKILAALASCRLASHVLCSLATPPIFSSITLTDAHNGSADLFVERATKLNDILAARNIAASIHSLALHRLSYETLDSSSAGAIMSAILSRLPHIQKFSLKAQDSTSFRSFQMDFVAAIEALCRSPNLTTLYLDGIGDFPFTTLKTSPNLRCLRIWGGLKFESANSRDGISLSHLLQLESLEVDTKLIRTLGSGISKDANCFPCLKNLQFKGLFYDTSCFSRGWDLMLLAIQTLKKLELTGGGILLGSDNMLASVPFDLGRFPALRHFKIERNGWFPKNQALLRFLSCLLSIPSSPSGIEVLEIGIIWLDVEDGHGKDLFSSDAGWSTLDELFTSQKFLSLRKVVLWLELRHPGWPLPPHILESERNLTLPHVNGLFPLFRASNTQRTLEIHLKVANPR